MCVCNSVYLKKEYLCKSVLFKLYAWLDVNFLVVTAAQPHFD